MIKKLKKQFMFIIMSIMTMVILVTFVSINLIMYNMNSFQTMNMMTSMAEHDGINPDSEPRPKPEIELIPKKNFGPINNFSVKLSHDDTITEVVSNFKIEYNDDQIVALTESALGTSKEYGNIDGNIRFLIKSRPYGRIIVFLDSRAEADIQARLLNISFLIGLSALVVIYFLAQFLSGWAIKPVQNSFEKQKQFVADASHELKTPLTVINMNVEVLMSREDGNPEDRKWLSYIKNEVSRMNKLVNDMLSLARIDSVKPISREFNISDAVESVVLPFEALVFEQNKKIDIDVARNIYLKGDEDHIKQVVAILMDNAVKNCSDNGIISVILNKYHNRIYLSVKNTGNNIQNTERIFERFYREDESRDRNTGGFGLGLSIAKSIVEQHEGKLEVKNIHDGVEFKMIL